MCHGASNISRADPGSVKTDAQLARPRVGSSDVNIPCRGAKEMRAQCSVFGEPEHGRPGAPPSAERVIYNLHLPAELVVLSACETGVGKSFGGEGVYGLARGFK